VILSKCFFGVSDDGSMPGIHAVSDNDGEMVNRVGLSRKHISDAVDASVARLGTYVLHFSGVPPFLEQHLFHPTK
jgi:versiconal hemiacetal acetate reductase